MTPIERSVFVFAVTGLYALFCVYCFWQCRRRSSGESTFIASSVNERDSGVSLLVAYASQSGFALSLAQQSAGALAASGRVRMLPLDRVNDAVLATTDHAFFIASTYGEGEPPDNGVRFARTYLHHQSAQLSHLKFAVLALGDSAYQHFCAFGHKLHSGLSAQGAVPICAPLELDSHSAHNPAEVIQRWNQQLSEFGADAIPVVEIDSLGEFQAWQLDHRSIVNPGSLGEPLVHLTFTPSPESGLSILQAPIPLWRAGDIAEIIPRNSVERCAAFAARFQLDANFVVGVENEAGKLIDELRSRDLRAADLRGPGSDDPQAIANWVDNLPRLSKREYSIASTPERGSLDLLVRMQSTDGVSGVASHWLGAGLNTADTIMLRLRSNPLFHAPASNIPMILIGNGSGFAGLRAHLQARELAGSRSNWLLFGERGPDTDRIFRDEISAWQSMGFLKRVDLTFSRCSRQSAYVQDAIPANSEAIKAWVATGAAIYVCGSRHGMAAGVDQQLRRVLGSREVDALNDAGLYRRDVY
jgi:sulfite reductase (NADPH) flavoprotein alpha-component